MSKSIKQKKERRRIIIDFEVLSEAGFWMCCMKDYQTGKEHTIINDREEFMRVFNKNKDSVWVGYNIKGYDVWIMKAIIADIDPCMVSRRLIKEHINGWKIDPSFNKIDVIIFELMTANNRGLKELELYMGEDIQESSVSFDLTHYPTDSEIEELTKYCLHDVRMTHKVFEEQYYRYEAQLGLVEYFNLNPLMLSRTEAQLSAYILGAKKPSIPRDDDYDFDIIDTLSLNKYKHVIDWYRNETNRGSKKTLNLNVYGVESVFGWGGMHSALNKYEAEEYIVHSDGISFYSAIMIEYNLLSRNVKDPQKFTDIRDNRVRLKDVKDPVEKSLKLVLTATSGGAKDEYNELYDPKQGNAVCVNGQLLLLDLIEKVEEEFGNNAKFIQGNTDGVIFKFNSKEDVDKYLKLCEQWCIRTRIKLDHDFIKRIIQKDVNNYIAIYEDDSIKRVGAYVKKLSLLDNDLPIVNKAITEKIINNVPIADTINNATNLIDFQKCVKITGQYSHGLHGVEPIHLKILRVFASKLPSDSAITKVRPGKNPERIPYTPDRAFIDNGKVKDKEIPDKLDREWYIELAEKRYEDFVKQDTYDLFDYLNSL